VYEAELHPDEIFGLIEAATMPDLIAFIEPIGP
jgi:hypothetical protein